MDHFEYKIMFSTQKLCISKEMIEHNGTTIPSQSILAIGIELINVAKIAVGQALGGALGGLVGGMIKTGSFGSSEEINKSGSLKELPESRGQLVITYQANGEEKMKVERIVINSADPECRKMLEKMAECYKGKFIGYGPQVLMEKELKISNKAVWIFAIAAILIFLGFAIFNFLASEGYVHS